LYVYQRVDLIDGFKKHVFPRSFFRPVPDTERPLLAQHVKEAANAIARWKRGFVTGWGWLGI
jgi:hypothetical protein